MYVEILGADGALVASGCVCSLCHRLVSADATDHVDLGQGPGLPVCIECQVDHDHYSTPEPHELLPWELWPGNVAEVA